MNQHERFESNTSNLSSRIEKELGLILENIQPLNSEDLGDNSEVYKADYQDKRVVVKLLKDDSQLRMEQAAFNLLGKYNVPVPEVFGVLPSLDSSKAIIVESEIAGAPISNLEYSSMMYEEVGRVLKEIHNIHIDGFGELEISDKGLIGIDRSSKENWDRYKTDFDLLESSGVINQDIKSKLEKAFELVSTADLPQASFLHNDFSPYHVFTDGKKITGIIDISACYAGDPRVDIAYMQYHLTGDELEAFNKGYGALAEDQLMSAFRLMTAADKLAYRVERGYKDRIPDGVKILEFLLKDFKF